MYFPLPIIHEVGQSCEWPTPVAFFAGLLHQPRPAFAQVESYLDDYAYLLKDSRFLQRTSSFDGKDDRSGSKLSSVLNLVLSTVRTLRAMKRLNSSGSAIPTASAWYLMLRGLASACSQDVLIMDDVPCVLPRFEALVEQERFESLASILICHCIKANDECDSDEELSSSSDRSSSEVVNHVRRNITVSEFLNPQLDVGEEEDSTFSYVESTQETTLPCLDIPLCANMLRGYGLQLCAVLPVICVADPDDVDFLLASVLYQRCVWGIDEPAIGITLEKTGFIARIIVGWVNRDHEPTVHIVHPYTPNGVPDSSLGIYDLTDPLSALSLANFILSLEPHFKEITSQAIIDRQRDPLCWRSDHDDTFDLCVCSTSDTTKGRQKIVDWLHNVTEAFVSTVFPSSSELFLFPSDQVDDSSACSPKETASATCAVIDESSGSTTFPQPPTLLATTRSTILHDDASQPSFVPSDAERKHMLLGSWNVSNWLLRRKAFIIPWASNMYHRISDYPEILKHSKEYEVLTRISWPDWSKDSMPEVDASVNWVKENLFHLYESEVQQSSRPTTPLDGAALQIITRKFTMLLNCVIGTDVVHVKENVSAYKSNAQQCWNWMIMQFCVTSVEEDISLNVHLEKTIFMPHARMLHELLDDNLVENKLKTTILDYYHQCFSDMPDRIHLYGRAASRDRQLFQVQVHDYRCEIRDHFSKPGSDPNITTKIIRRQAKLDPSSLICDAVLCTSISVDKELPSNIQEKAHEFLRQSQFITSSKTGPYDALLPFMVFQYKDWKRTAKQTRDEAIMCCVSSVSFLASLGIKSFPVHGLIATGRQARVIVAYQSLDTDNIYVTAENVWHLDLENPLNAFHFATFLLRIRQQYEPRLIELFRTEFPKKLQERDDASVYMSWAMDM